MADVMLSLRENWCEKILSGEKTVEVRLSWPVQKETPYRVFLYQTGKRPGGGKIVGECTLERLEYADAGFHPSPALITDSCLTAEQLTEYARGRTLYFWHLRDAVRYDQAKPLRAFLCHGFRMRRPPQSWCYVEEGEREG